MLWFTIFPKKLCNFKDKYAYVAESCIVDSSSIRVLCFNFYSLLMWYKWCWLCSSLCLFTLFIPYDKNNESKQMQSHQIYMTNVLEIIHTMFSMIHIYTHIYIFIFYLLHPLFFYFFCWWFHPWISEIIICRMSSEKLFSVVRKKRDWS